MIRTSFNRHWYVTAESSSRGGRVGPVTLPYDAMLFEERDPNTKNGGNTGFFPGGVYRYTKAFGAPEEWRGRSVVVEFEGVYHRSKVFVNGRLANERPSGYALFHVAIDDYLEYGTQNTIEVVADNSDEPNSRWYTGSGIYRPVSLLIGEPVHIAPTGLRVSTDGVSNGTATVNVDTEIVNDGTASQVLTVRVSLTSPSGADVEPVTGDVLVPAGGHARIREHITVP